jgi:hypothetical protein
MVEPDRYMNFACCIYAHSEYSTSLFHSNSFMNVPTYTLSYNITHVLYFYIFQNFLSFSIDHIYNTNTTNNNNSKICNKNFGTIENGYHKIWIDIFLDKGELGHHPLMHNSRLLLRLSNLE